MAKDRSRARTSIDIPERTRAKVCALLQERLSDTIDLHWQCKQAHWTVRGPSFMDLHELFDQIAGEALTYADDLAERIQALGGHAVGLISHAAKESGLKAYPADAQDQSKHIDAIAAALARYGGQVRKAIDECADLKDQGSADLFTGISRGVDKSLWFVESHRGG
jgi:starvation-inducible DNA-binding protein